jgi:hypothetical protein
VRQYDAILASYNKREEAIARAEAFGKGACPATGPLPATAALGSPPAVA